MTKSKKLWARAALASFIIAAVSGYTAYSRFTARLSDTAEPAQLKPPMPPALKNDAPEERKNSAASEVPPAPAAAQAAAPGESAKQKAVKTLFEYKNASARSVLLAGSFSKWKELRMAKKNGIWRTEVYILPGNYLYHFKVDGKKKLDPGKPKAPAGESIAIVQ